MYDLVYDVKCTRGGSCNSPSTERLVKSSDYVVCGKCNDPEHMRLHTVNTHNKRNSRMRCNSQEMGSRTCNTTRLIPESQKNRLWSLPLYRARGPSVVTVFHMQSMGFL